MKGASLEGVLTWHAVRQTGAELGVEPIGTVVLFSIGQLPRIAVESVVVVIAVVVVVGGGGINI